MMKLRRLILFASAALALAASALADDTKPDAWPELDAFVGLSGKSRLFLSAALSRSRQESYVDITFGAHVDFFLKPISRAWLRHTPDIEKRRYLSFRIGYRYGQGLGDDADSYREQRVVLEATARAYLPGRLVALNRNRFDLRDLQGEGSWRYRNRTRLEREFPAWSRSLTTYAMAEFFYDSRYDSWSRTRYYAGLEWPLGRTSVLDTYYCRQDDSQPSPAHVNALGLALNVYF
jgi:hypothetical protein